jgi:hypothetical protein
VSANFRAADFLFNSIDLGSHSGILFILLLLESVKPIHDHLDGVVQTGFWNTSGTSDWWCNTKIDYTLRLFCLLLLEIFHFLYDF